MYCSDFASMCSREASILYVNDAVLVYVDTWIEQLTEQFNNVLHDTLEWCNSKKISLNPSKPDSMVVTNKSLIDRPQLFIGPNTNKQFCSFSYLGVYVVTRLKYNVQNNHTRSRLSQLHKWSAV